MWNSTQIIAARHSVWMLCNVFLSLSVSVMKENTTVHIVCVVIYQITCVKMKTLSLLV